MPNMTGRPGYRTMEINGRSFRAVPRLYTLRSPVLYFVNRGGNIRAFRLAGAGGDHFNCAVEPSPGHIRFQEKVVDGFEEFSEVTPNF